MALHQTGTFEAAVQFSQAEGIVPAPESAHAVKAAIDEALKCKEDGTSRVIGLNLSGHGLFDLSAYETYLARELEDYEYPDAAIQEAMAHLPEVTL